MKIIVVKPHDTEPDLTGYKNVYKTFLAGTIDAGNSHDWQSEYINEMIETARSVSYLRKGDEGYNINDDVIVIYNPRRDSGEGFKTNNYKEMDYQVNWELEHLDMADVIYMNLLPDSKSPISLMEIGLYASSGKLKIVCPKEFYRYDNVRIVCKKYKIPMKHYKNDKWETIIV